MGITMRFLILVIILISIAYIVTDPRWEEGGASSIAAPWEGGLSSKGFQPASNVYLDENERCAFVAAWLSNKKKQRLPINVGELAAADRVLDSCGG
jgi:hypothetical protein